MSDGGVEERSGGRRSGGGRLGREGFPTKDEEDCSGIIDPRSSSAAWETRDIVLIWDLVGTAADSMIACVSDSSLLRASRFNILGVGRRLS